MKKYTRGFTLIELLVVIAIIGILASVVLVSLNSARQKGKDARVISDVQQIRTALESGYNGTAYPDLKNDGNVGLANSSNASCYTNGWTNAGPQSSVITQLIADACSQSGTVTAIQINTNNPGANPVTSYAIKGFLTSSNGYFCIDSTGKTNAADNSTASVTCN